MSRIGFGFEHFAESTLNEPTATFPRSILVLISYWLLNLNIFLNIFFLLPARAALHLHFTLPRDLQNNKHTIPDIVVIPKSNLPPPTFSSTTT